MIKFVEETLQEMAYPCRKGDGYGMIIEVRSNDHGILDNKSSPTHAHIMDINKNDLGKFIIVSRRPTKPKDIEWYQLEAKPIPDGYAVKIVDWAKDNKSDPLKKNNWDYLVRLWTGSRPEK